MSAVSPVRRSRTGWWISGLLLVAAIVCVIVAVTSFLSFRSQVNGFQRVSAPGQRVVTFSGTGGYQLYFEGPGQGRGNADVVLRSTSTGQPVKISVLHGSSTSYTLSGHSGQAVGSFTISQPGRYVLAATTPAAGAAPADVAVGGGLGGGIVRGVLFIVAGVLLFFGALLAALITAIRRRRGCRITAPAQGAPMPSGSMPRR